MKNMNIIAANEAVNRSSIYLYCNDGIWCAYEHSAYHLFSLFQTGTIRMMDDYICIVLDRQLGFLDAESISSLCIDSVSDTEIKIDCGTVFSGFEEWKQAHSRNR